ncbi:MAG TPA: DUF2939 domain-containing protein [Allosphingosinicella sp.]
MSSARTLALAAAAFIALAAAGWWFGSPWWTLRQMREAAQAGDSDALAAYVDFPALRASTRAQLRPRLGPLAGLLAGPAVDAAISPEALRLALLHTGGSLDGDGRGGEGGGDGGGAGEVDLVRTGASEFRVEREGHQLVFRRHGLGWRLSRVTLPE